MNTETNRNIEFDQGPSNGLDHSLLTYQQLNLIHYLILGLNLYLYLCLSPYPVLYLVLYLYLYLVLYLYLYLVLYLVPMDKQQLMDDLTVWGSLSDLHQNHKKEEFIWRKEKQNKNYFTQSKKQQRCSVALRRQCPDLYTAGHYQQYDLEPQFEFPVWAFRSGWIKTHDIIQGARDRLCKEQAHAI